MVVVRERNRNFFYGTLCTLCTFLAEYNWAGEASPTLGCSIEISRDIYICACVYRMSN